MKKLAVLLVVLLAVSCKKRVECSGLVLSKHRVPMANQEVQIVFYTSDEAVDGGHYSVRTDIHGVFVFNRRIPKNRNLDRIEVLNADSGNYKGGFEARKNQVLVLR